MNEEEKFSTCEKDQVRQVKEGLQDEVNIFGFDSNKDAGYKRIKVAMQTQWRMNGNGMR